jgi:hypothetical protein
MSALAITVVRRTANGARIFFAGIEGQDSCHCVAVSVRAGTEFNKPDHCDEWEAEGSAVTRDLRAADEPVNLSTLLREMHAA